MDPVCLTAVRADIIIEMVHRTKTNYFLFAHLSREGNKTHAWQFEGRHSQVRGREEDQGQGAYLASHQVSLDAGWQRNP